MGWKYLAYQARSQDFLMGGAPLVCCCCDVPFGGGGGGGGLEAC